jgi:large subunit ribosomal protein L21
MAIISVAGKQYLVSQGDTIITSKLSQKEGESFEVKDMLSGQALSLKVIKSGKGPKIRVLKFKKKKGYRRVYGSRPAQSVVEVTAKSSTK